MREKGKDKCTTFCFSQPETKKIKHKSKDGRIVRQVKQGGETLKGLEGPQKSERRKTAIGFCDREVMRAVPNLRWESSQDTPKKKNRQKTPKKPEPTTI